MRNYLLLGACFSLMLSYPAMASKEERPESFLSPTTSLSCSNHAHDEEERKILKKSLQGINGLMDSAYNEYGEDLDHFVNSNFLFGHDRYQIESINFVKSGYRGDFKALKGVTVGVFLKNAAHQESLKKEEDILTFEKKSQYQEMGGHFLLIAKKILPIVEDFAIAANIIPQVVPSHIPSEKDKVSDSNNLFEAPHEEEQLSQSHAAPLSAPSLFNLQNSFSQETIDVKNTLMGITRLKECANHEMAQQYQGQQIKFKNQAYVIQYINLINLQTELGLYLQSNARESFAWREDRITFEKKDNNAYFSVIAIKSKVNQESFSQESNAVGTNRDEDQVPQSHLTSLRASDRDSIKSLKEEIELLKSKVKTLEEQLNKQNSVKE